ncbi:MAG: hypothetical protein ACFNLN_11050, partial [Treponema socranskii subsp. buccale]
MIGIGLRELFCQKVRLPSVRAARRQYRCLAFRLFIYTHVFYAYISGTLALHTLNFLKLQELQDLQ